MRIINFSVKNYRSITKAYNLPLGEKSILIGPNNEGKSNVLNALVLMLNNLSKERFRRYIKSFRREIDVGYDFRKDFPLNLQDNPKQRTELKIEFELSEIEKIEFRKKLQSKLSSNLIISLKFDRHKTDFNIVLQGRAKKSLQQKRETIAKFLSDHINFQYIPSIRTAAFTIDIIDTLITRVLKVLDSDLEYQKLLKDLERYRNKILTEMSEYLKVGVSEFLDNIRSIKIEQSLRRAFRESFKLYVDDGNSTELSQKGDGIKSLIAISLVRYLSKRASKEQNLILAIEEPESHLHPAAIHRISNILNEISKEHQIIISTHSPLLVDMKRVKNNIIVNKGKAIPAKTISDVRDILGVKVSDNLSSARLVLLCEGFEDQKILSAWLKNKSSLIEDSLDKSIMVVADMGGGTNLSYNASLYKNLMCEVVAFLDDDQCARNAFTEAKKNGRIDNSNVRFAKCKRRKNSEIEDMVEQRLYLHDIESYTGAKIDQRVFEDKNLVWSDRLKKIMNDIGAPWDNLIESELKKIVVSKVIKYPDVSIQKGCSGPIDELVRILEEKLK